MTSPFRLDMLDVLQYFHDQLVPRLEFIQDVFDRREYDHPALRQLQEEVHSITRTAEHLEEMAMHYGDGKLAYLFDTLGYAGRECGMGAPFKGLSELATLQQDLNERRADRQTPRATQNEHE
jgi:hypothetical protein